MAIAHLFLDAARMFLQKMSSTKSKCFSIWSRFKPTSLQTSHSYSESDDLNNFADDGTFISSKLLALTTVEVLFSSAATLSPNLKCHMRCRAMEFRLLNFRSHFSHVNSSNSTGSEVTETLSSAFVTIQTPSCTANSWMKALNFPQSNRWDSQRYRQCPTRRSTGLHRVFSTCRHFSHISSHC